MGTQRIERKYRSGIVAVTVSRTVYRCSHVLHEHKTYHQALACEERLRDKAAKEEAERADMLEIVAERKARREQRNQSILLMRESGMTYEAIGKQVGLTASRVSQLYKKGKMRADRSGGIEVMGPFTMLPMREL